MSGKNEHNYPLAAIVGQEAMVEALKLIAVDPGIGGLLLQGEKGTAKSTAARAIAELLPPFKSHDCPYHCKPASGPADVSLLCPVCRAKKTPIRWTHPPFKTIPLGVTEERLLGGLDFEATMRDGIPVFRQGILGEANNGLVYVDEVNLLDPALAHLMLDAVSSGKVVTEREGFSFSLPGRVALLGSMNPEEGPLGPQLSDRFAMSVVLKGEEDPVLRKEIVLRRLAFERDPGEFARLHREEGKKITEAIAAAANLLKNLEITKEARELAAKMSASARTQGHRAELALCRAARASRALNGPRDLSPAGPEWVERVWEFVIPFRRRVAVDDKKTVATREYESYEGDRANAAPDAILIPDVEEAPPDRKEQTAAFDEKILLHVFKSEDSYSIITPKLKREVGLKEQKGRRSSRESDKARGRAYKTTARRLGRPLSLSATLRAAAPHQRERTVAGKGAPGKAAGSPKVLLKPSDFREKVYRQKTGRLVIFVVDSSGSIGTLYRMEEAKAAAMSLLNDAYQKRDKVAIIAFYGNDAEILLPPTNSPDMAGRLLANLPSGGKTPMAAALALTHKLLRTERAKDPMVSPFIILMTDGRPNIPLDPKAEPWREVLRFADLLAQDPTLNFLLIDTDRGAYNEFKLTRELGKHLNAPKISLEDLREGQLTKWLNHEP
ncbi:MAG: VWA domain-containing protein [Deltaproteobacteria bacterium]|jgi:magnesium chelatase subunit D|nr:VWA domain-containing protein [Deltaproteobacteria bacterium]